MRQRLKPLMVGLCVLGLSSSTAFAAVSADALQAQIDQLQKQVRLLKAQEQRGSHVSQADHSYASNSVQHHRNYANSAAVNGGAVNSTQNSTTDRLPQHNAVSSDKASPSPDAYVTGQQNPPNVAQYLPIDIDVPGQSFVSSGPYLGIPLVYSGGNLIINSPNINEDVTLLGMRKNINERLNALGRGQIDDHAHLLLSGIVEAQGFYIDHGVGPTTSDIDLTSAELDGYILGPSNWTSGLISFAYDNDRGTDEGSLNNNSRVQSSRLFLNKAFIVIGNFEKSPYYSSFGQMYIPFGTYASNMISSPITKLLGRSKERAFVIGYQAQGQNAFYAAGYVFRGDSYVSAPRINNGGINVGYRFGNGELYSGDMGFGILNNLGASQGMQNNGQPSPFFGGFGATGGFGNEQLIHTVRGLNFHGMWSIGKNIDLLAEYVGAMTSFSPTDLSYRSHGAKPQALSAEAAYTFTAFDRPSSIALGYAKSRDALAVGLPLARYSVVFNTSIWKDTLQSLEFRHDQNYAASSYASGDGPNVSALIYGSGRADNMVTAQFDLYF